MDIERLPAGKSAPIDSDCIKIIMEEGRYSLIASALSQCETDEAVSEAVVISDDYRTYDEAEQAAIAWAGDRCVKTLYIEAL